MDRRLAGAFALATVLMVARAPRADAPRVVERVVGVVDGRPILSSELLRRAAPHERALAARAMPEWRRAPLRRRLLRDTLERLIEERLVQHAALRQGVSVGEREIDAALDRVATSQGYSLAELELAAVAQGWLIAEYREQIAAQLLEGMLLQQHVAARRRRPSTAEEWAEERKQWLAELRRQSFVELRLSR